MTALSPWDATIYPHQQVMGDIQGMQAAVAALSGPVDTDAAFSALAGTYLTWYGVNFSLPGVPEGARRGATPTTTASTGAARDTCPSRWT